MNIRSLFRSFSTLQIALGVSVAVHAALERVAGGLRETIDTYGAESVLPLDRDSLTVEQIRHAARLDPIESLRTE